MIETDRVDYAFTSGDDCHPVHGIAADLGRAESAMQTVTRMLASAGTSCALEMGRAYQGDRFPTQTRGELSFSATC